MKSLNIATCTVVALLIFLSSVVNARVYQNQFVPEYVTVADGYLHIGMPFSAAVEGCELSSNIVLPDDHKYFRSYLSLALSAMLAKKKITVAIGSPCRSSHQWPQIHVLRLHE